MEDSSVSTRRRTRYYKMLKDTAMELVEKRFKMYPKRKDLLTKDEIAKIVQYEIRNNLISNIEDYDYLSFGLSIYQVEKDLISQLFYSTKSSVAKV